MKKFISLAMIVGLSMFSFSLTAQQEEEIECSQDILISYFPEPFVKETLNRFNIPQSKWEAITQELSGKDEEVVKTVEEKAEKMDPNPLRDLKLRQEAVRIFRETLLQVFTSVMRLHGVTDPQQIQVMLDDIQQQKAKFFAQCMEKYTTPDEESTKPKEQEEPYFKPNTN